ncbi:MAG: hypothetical protein ACM3Q4_08280 [Acidobacteriota bacterium]
MRKVVCLVVFCALWLQSPLAAQQADSAAGARTLKQKHAGRDPHGSSRQTQRQTPVPSIIQSELERSRAEEAKQKALHPTIQIAAPQPSASSGSPLWAVLIAVLVAGAATGAIVYVFFLRRHARFRPASATPPGRMHAERPVPEAVMPSAPAPDVRTEEEMEEEDEIASASPYAIEEESEMPEAALTMNLLNKKRETKKELIQEVMRRVQRKEKPQQIAEALHVGIGEVQLAITLAKMKK